MLLTAAEFDRKTAQNQLRIALIGMSNIGKSYTAQRIAKTSGFSCYDVDAQIQAKLGKNTMSAMAEWMGHPYSDGYAEKSAEYLNLEADLSLAANQGKGNLVLDTSGSVVHIPQKNKISLNNSYLIVYIEANDADIDTLIDRYFKYPKPTIWGDCYHVIDGKSAQDSLVSCYPDLLAHRAKLYAELSNITIKAADFSDPNMSSEDILLLIRSHLP